MNNNLSFANRGMNLENDINLSNMYYLEKNIAIIYKKPTPIKVTKVSFNNLKQSKITEGYYLMPSTTDYNGIYKSKYIDFEAKETNCKTSFSLSNIHLHQIKHLINIHNHGGISFIIVRFSPLNKTYILFTKDLKDFIEKEKRKSIPIDYFNSNGYLIKEKYCPRIDYIEIIEKEYFGG